MFENNTQPKKDTQAVESEKVTNKKESDNVVDLPAEELAQITYNIEEITDFLDLVFHYDGGQEEQVLLYTTNMGSSPVYPASETTVLRKLGKARRPMACYLATATAYPDETDGKLYNRQKLFASMRVLVLDDIGTKVSPDLIPEALKPTYIIESSPNNFQYGYVFEEPIADLNAAKALIQEVYSSGLTDTGGAMPNKIVRLPCGVNGKNNENKLFNVKLVSSNGPLWTPKRLLEVIGSGDLWDKILEDAEAAMRTSIRNSRVNPTAGMFGTRGGTLDGVIDEVYECLLENDLVRSESNEWMQIECPWALEHTSGDGSAGYSPLGYGGKDHAHTRGFKCFHDHCSERTSVDFLDHIAETFGITAPVAEKTAWLSRHVVFDTAGADRAYLITDSGKVTRQSTRGLGHLPESKVKVTVKDRQGKVKLITALEHYKNSPYAMAVTGEVIDYTNRARIVEREGMPVVNTAEFPQWGDGDFDQACVNVFIEFVEYLVPNVEERELLLDWMAAKTQDLTFRGWGIVMVAEGAQGIGRTTFADIFARLLLESNVANVKFSELTNVSQFNYWQSKLLVVTDESLDAVRGAGDRRRGYESLKDIIDPRDKLVTINRKGLHPFDMRAAASHLIFSNHIDAVAIDSADRRLFAIENPHTPWPSSKFVALNEWIDTNTWQTHVWRWLRQRKVDLEVLEGKAPATETKLIMAEAAKSPLSVAVAALVDFVSRDGIVPVTCINDVMKDYRVTEILKGGSANPSRNALRSVLSELGVIKVIKAGFVLREGDKTRAHAFRIARAYEASWMAELTEIHDKLKKPHMRVAKDRVVLKQSELPPKLAEAMRLAADEMPTIPECVDVVVAALESLDG